MSVPLPGGVAAGRCRRRSCRADTARTPTAGSASATAPRCVGNDVNLMALGELRSDLSRTERDHIYFKVGAGIAG